MRPSVYMLSLTAIALIILNIWFMLSLALPGPYALELPRVEKPVVEYKDFIAILLTAVTVVIAVLAFGVAVLAIWGYNQITKQIEDKAAEVAARGTDDYFNGERLINRVDNIIRTQWDAIQKEGAGRNVQPPTTPEGKKDGDDGLDLPTLPPDWDQPPGPRRGGANDS